MPATSNMRRAGPGGQTITSARSSRPRTARARRSTLAPLESRKSTSQRSTTNAPRLSRIATSSAAVSWGAVPMSTSPRTSTPGGLGGNARSTAKPGGRSVAAPVITDDYPGAIARKHDRAAPQRRHARRRGSRRRADAPQRLHHRRPVRPWTPCPRSGGAGLDGNPVNAAAWGTVGTRRRRRSRIAPCRTRPARKLTGVPPAMFAGGARPEGAVPPEPGKLGCTSECP